MKKLALLILTLISFSCKNNPPVKKHSAAIDRSDKKENISPYEIGKKYVFTYYYIDSLEQKLSYKFLAPFYATGKDGNKEDFSWELVSLNDTSSVKKFSIGILEGKVNGNQIPIMYCFYQNSKKVVESVTGLLQDENKVWIHPPRTKGFRILEINPFPFVKLPLKKGMVWKDTLMIGGQWGDKRWATWKGGINSVATYENKGTIKISSPFGKLKTHKIVASGASRIGKTKTIAYFNKKYGFVKLVYHNINGSQLVLNLIEVKEQAEPKAFNSHF